MALVCWVSQVDAWLGWSPLVKLQWSQYPSKIWSSDLFGWVNFYRPKTSFLFVPSRLNQIIIAWLFFLMNCMRRYGFLTLLLCWSAFSGGCFTRVGWVLLLSGGGGAHGGKISRSTEAPRNNQTCWNKLRAGKTIGSKSLNSLSCMLFGEIETLQSWGCFFIPWVMAVLDWRLLASFVAFAKSRHNV